MTDDVPAGATKRTVDTGDIRLRILEQGSGPAVILCHGFPGLAFSWRHQLRALAAHGYRAIAPDMRGYGGSDAPVDSLAYDRRHTVADLTGLLDALELDDAVFSGHDFGTTLVWDLPQWAPGRVRGLIQLSVPRRPAGGRRPSAAHRQTAENHFLHLHYFQQPGVADLELAAAPAEFLRRNFWALSVADGTWTSSPDRVRGTATSTSCPTPRRSRGPGCPRRSSTCTPRRSRGPASPVG